VTLTKRLAGPRFSIVEARGIGADIATGVAHIHKQGMEHGDLHSDNVMIIGGGAKVIDILYCDSLAVLSTGSREALVRRDRASLRLMLQQIIMHSELDAADATEFNNMVADNASTVGIRDAFLQIVEASNLADTERRLDHGYARVIDEGFVEGKDYASALIDETPEAVTVSLLKKIIDERAYEHKHRDYLKALWARLLKEERSMILSSLGVELEKELPKGRWWPLLRMISELRREGWKGLSPRVRLRLEKLIVKDVLAGYVDIHRPAGVKSGGNLGTYARRLWPYFAKPRILAENITTLLHQSWYTQNYVGKHFLPELPDLCEATDTTDEMIRALRTAVANDARIVVNALEELPEEWVARIRQEILAFLLALPSSIGAPFAYAEL